MNAHAVNLVARKLKIAAPRPFLDWLLATEEIAGIVEEGRRRPPERFFEGALSALGVSYTCSEQDQKRIPASGPVVLVANHPFGLLEGLILGSLLERLRPDYRFVANSLLEGIPEVGERIIPVDPFGDISSVRENGQSLRKAHRWLAGGGVLVTFPAGEVSNLQGMPPAIVDRAWNTRLVRMARRTGAPVVPAYFFGRNSLKFQVAGLVHPAIRTALLCRELVNKRGRHFTLAIGSPITPERLKSFETDRDVTDYVRERTYALEYRAEGVCSRSRRAGSPIAPAQSPDALEADVSALPAGALLYAKGDYQAFVARSSQMPHLLPEIGRLREISFRAAGEGTGLASDLDRFDVYYNHLFLWRSSTREIAGAYRIAEVDAVLDQYGPNGLYTHTLFRFEPEFLDRMRPGLELGRSFIRPEYQRSIHPLHYLWKAIGAYLARRPRRYLFGPVSISEEYTQAARELIVSYFEERCRERVVKPRCRFRSHKLRRLDVLAKQARSVSELCELISDFERDGKEIPVLLRHYLNLGGQVLGFNVDRDFSNALDGLLLLDLERSNSEVLHRYLGSLAVRQG